MASGEKLFKNYNCGETSSMKAYTISGVPIMFPYRAYPSQITMMDKIVKCLNKKYNCLLESPTGSGKSLALLCACLAWQKKTSKEILELEAQLDLELNACGTSLPDESSLTNDKSKVMTFDKKKYEYVPQNKKEPVSKCPSCQSSIKIESDMNQILKDNSKHPTIFCLDEDDDDFVDFKPAKRYRPSLPDNTNIDLNSSTNKQCNCESKNIVDNSSEFTYNFPTKVKQEKNIVNKNIDSVGNAVPTKLPKIYFGTRTHKQIEQIIRELKKTPYKNSKMSILSSRERTCIHPIASEAVNKNEACDELLKAEGGPGCKFYRMAKTVSHFNPSKLGTAYDLEELVQISYKACACPYFASRELMQTSDIVFCPYNYLVDPLIRSALSINLKNSILIMDEAHNIEDSARSAASSKFSLSVLEECISNLEKVGRFSNTIADCYLYIAKVLSKMASWLKANKDNLTDYVTFDSSAKVWAGDNMLAVLNYIELGPESYLDFRNKCEIILAEESDTDKQQIIDMDKPKLLGQTLNYLKSLNQILTYLYKDKLVHVPDYRCVIIKSKPSKNTFFRNVGFISTIEISLNFWCLNPAVAFSDLKETHSIIVASGTLSPLVSFQSELGIPFQISLEANHVIASSQTWVGTIGKGPSNTVLSATFQNSSTFTFQDDLGDLVYQVCTAVPHGVLCFLPSYSMMEKLLQRWHQIGLWDRLERKKLVVCEPRKQAEFEAVISEFYNAIKRTENCPIGEIDGALFFAICRGKVSEGLDFADNNARAVITVGIPFPNIKDPQVDLKRKYNDMHAAARKLTTGTQWYEIQAFRALNQALGRCIRHRNDYGALIIVDERFQRNNRYPDSLSKWIRKEIVHYSSSSVALNSLNLFTEKIGLKKISLCEETISD